LDHIWIIFTQINFIIRVIIAIENIITVLEQESLSDEKTLSEKKGQYSLTQVLDCLSTLWWKQTKSIVRYQLNFRFLFRGLSFFLAFQIN